MLCMRAACSCAAAASREHSLPSCIETSERARMGRQTCLAQVSKAGMDACTTAGKARLAAVETLAS